MKRLGVALGVLLLIMGSMRLWITYKAGNPNWYLLVMICGMALLLLYTLTGSRKS